MADGTIEIIDGKARRRRWSLTEKLRIVAETEEPGATVRAVAARHDVYPSLLRMWRRQVRDGQLSAASATRFVPIHMAEVTSTAVPVMTEPVAASTMEIVLPDGVRLRLGSDVGVAALRRVLTVLRG
jgi:transposase